MIEIISLLVGIIVSSVGGTLTLVIMNKADNSLYRKDDILISNDIRGMLEQWKESDNDILSLMMKNVSELREYYVISKRQANRVFTSTLLICIFGFIIFIAGIIVSYFTPQNIVLYTTISGSIIELISGLFFWLYNRTLTQLNLYHERLGSTEKYLTAIQLIDKMSDEKKDENYRYLIEAILLDNSTITRNINNSSEMKNEEALKI